MADEFSTSTLIGVVEGLQRPPSFMLDRYFPTVSQDESEEIHFDKIVEKRRISPFVSPVLAGKVVESLGRQVNTFKPAYIKDKRVFDPTQPIKRAIGERIGGGELSNAQRRDAHLARELADQLQMLTRRLELMACEAIRTGKVTVTGDGYPTTVVDFGRDAALTVAALAGTLKWGAADAVPLKNLRAWAKLVRKASGVQPNDVIMGDDAFEAFIADAKVEARLNNRNVSNVSMAPTNPTQEGGVYQGTVDGFNIFTYSGWYVDPADGVEKEFFPADVVAMTSSGVAGVRAFGAIKDGKAGLRALPYFPKMWEDEDPSVEYLMLQSSPLMVPTRPNATLSIDVL